MSHITQALFVGDLATVTICTPEPTNDGRTQLRVGVETWGGVVSYTRAYMTAAECRQVATAWLQVADKIDQLPANQRATEAPL